MPTHPFQLHALRNDKVISFCFFFYFRGLEITHLDVVTIYAHWDLFQFH